MSYQILIVDDDQDFREELKECLCDYKVIEASSGQQALEIIKKPNAIDVVLLDVVMSGLSGIDVLKQIKSTNPKLVIIMLTGQSNKDTAIEALKAHADDYIEKPFQTDQFLKTIQKVLSSRGHMPHGHSLHAKMEQAKQFIDRNFDKKITLSHVADQLCLSPKYFSRAFKQNTGTGFNEYRLGVKIHRAGELLKATDATVSDLADQLGYKNTESFIRVFKNLMGCTPTEYRHKKKPAK